MKKSKAVPLAWKSAYVDLVDENQVKSPSLQEI
jgi:hypothetical protein